MAFGDFAYAYAEYLKELGVPCPHVRGPNRSETRLVPRKIVERFRRDLSRKRELQESGRYRLLWWRKATLEMGRLAARYLRWFFVRVLKIKTLLGVRDEKPHRDTSVFK